MRERIRVGIAVRREQLRFNLSAPMRISDSGILNPGSYTAGAAAPLSRPAWGIRLKSFRTADEAETFVDQVVRSGTGAEVRRLGRSVEIGGIDSDSAYFWAVCAGKWSTSDLAVAEGRDLQHRVFDALGILPYPDFFTDPEALRLTSSSGGEELLLHADHSLDRRFRSPLTLEPVEPEKASFDLDEIRLGVDFHWDHRERLAFRGSLELIVDEGGVTAVNELPLDDYLASLLGSEMRPDWPLDALVAQTVAARSTVLATRGRHHYGEAFDLCHDDHCQCYQGVGRESALAREAFGRAPNALLVFGRSIADARYAKSCGGISESYDIAWEDWDLEYLHPVVCGPVEGTVGEPQQVDDRSDASTLRQVLADPPVDRACNPLAKPYPQSSREMEPLYRWSRELQQDRLQELVQLRFGLSLGYIKSLRPLGRGASGRIRYLRVEGEEGTLTVGKELAVRRLLSSSHLPSSAFQVESLPDGGFALEGIGWGHGVGMCQLGAAALAQAGWSWRDILAHYYAGSRILGE